MSKFENNFKLVKRLLSSRVPPDVADRIAHESLDKRGFLTMVDPIGALVDPIGALVDPIGALDAQLKRPQRHDLRSIPGYMRLVARVDALLLAELTDRESFVDALGGDDERGVAPVAPGEQQVMAPELDIVVEEGENLRKLLIDILSAGELGMLPALSHLKARAAKQPEAVLGSVIGKLTKVLQQRKRQLEEFADGLTVQEYEVVHKALDLWT
jgi:hypothetical protein